MNLLNAYARCVRIVRDQGTRYPVEPDRFTDPASTRLYQALKKARTTIPEQSPTINEVLGAIQTLVSEINTFFDGVLVMAQDQAVRENRLGLLQEIASLTEGVADFTKLEGF